MILLTNQISEIEASKYPIEILWKLDADTFNMQGDSSVCHFEYQNHS